MSVSDKNKNRGTHGDSSFMLGRSRPSSENPPALAVGSVKEGEDFCIVQCGDTLESISEKYLGSRELVPLLIELNDVSYPLIPGNLLWLHPEGLEPEH